MRIEHTLDIDAPAERVWDLTVDIESWPGLTPTITAVERLDTGPLSVGSQARVKQPGQPTRVWTVTELSPGERFAWSTRAMGTTMTGSHEVRRTAGTTSNTLSVDIDGPLAAVVGRLARRPILRAIAAENDGFRAAAEL